MPSSQHRDQSKWRAFPGDGEDDIRVRRVSIRHTLRRRLPREGSFRCIVPAGGADGPRAIRRGRGHPRRHGLATSGRARRRLGLPAHELDRHVLRLLHSSSDGGPHPFRRLGACHFPLSLHGRCMAPGATPGALASRSEANSRALGRGIGARASPRVAGVVAGTRLPRFTSLVAHRRRANAGWFTATSPRPLLRHPSSPLRRLLGLPCLQSLS